MIRRLTFWNICSILFNNAANNPIKEIPAKTLNPYINFAGKCREAMAFYKDCFHGIH